MLRTRLVTGAAIAALLLLSGCSTPDDDSDAVETATPTAEAATNTASPSPEPSAAATKEPEPTPPPGFERNDDVGAQAAAQYAADVLLYTVRTGDETVLDRLEWPGTCSYCGLIRSVMEDRHNEAESITGGEATVEILKVYAYDEMNDGYPLDVRFSESESTLWDANGAYIRTESAGTIDYRIEFRHDGTTWRLINMVNLERLQ